MIRLADINDIAGIEQIYLHLPGGKPSALAAWMDSPKAENILNNGIISIYK